jgi:hypothetical protein
MRLAEQSQEAPVQLRRRTTMRHVEEQPHLHADPLQPHRDRQMVERSSVLGFGSSPSDLDRRIGEIEKCFRPDGDVDLFGPNRDAGDEAIVERDPPGSVERRPSRSHRPEFGDRVADPDRIRSEERRVGKECRRLCRSRWSPYH